MTDFTNALTNARTKVWAMETSRIDQFDSAWDQTYQMAAFIYDFSFQWLKDEFVADLGTELDRCQIPTAQPGANQLLPIVRLVTGKFDLEADKVEFNGKADLTKFDCNRSWEKHADAISFMWDHQEDVTAAGGAYAYIKGYAGHLNGLNKAYKVARNAARSKGQVANVASEDEAIEAVKVYSKRTLDELKPLKDEHFALVWCQVVDDKLVPGGVISKSGKAAKAAAIASGRTLVAEQVNA
jgi:hypothetical protein